MNNHLISLTVLFPLIGVIVQTFLPTQKSRWFALGSSIASSICAIVLVLSMQTHSADLQGVESYPWVGAYAMSYEMAIDGLNVLCLLLIAILFPVLIAAEWEQKIGGRGLHALLLVLQTALVGSVCAQDLFLQFFFWGLTALPVYFLVGIWGGENRERAAFQSTVAAAIGNALLFMALILIYYSAEPHSFSFKDLSGSKFLGHVFLIAGHSFSVSGLSFVLVSMGLALRAPIWPLNGWFSETAKEAPFSVFVAVAAVIVPVATYIFLKITYSLFPEIMSQASHVIVVIGVVNLVVGAVCGISQRGLRSLMSFICLSEVGLVLIGLGSLSPTGLVGAVYLQFMFGLGLAGFGLFSGVVSDRAGYTEFLGSNGEKMLGGIAQRAPALAVVAGVVLGSLLGFPGFAGFIGRALVLIGSYSVHPVAVLVAGAALLLGSYHLFNMYRSVFLGETAQSHVQFDDLSFWERGYMFPIVAAIIFFGLYPKPLIDLIRPTVLTLLSTIR